MEFQKFRIQKYFLLSIGFAIAFACTDTKSTEDPPFEKSYKAQRYYVSLVGNDLVRGSKRHPFAILERARKAVQSMDKSGKRGGVKRMLK